MPYHASDAIAQAIERTGRVLCAPEATTNVLTTFSRRRHIAIRKSLPECEQASDLSVVVDGHVQIAAGDRDVGVARGVADFGQRSAAGQCMAEEGVATTRDKIAAARRKGKWLGGMPILGYNVVQTKLVVGESEAECVRRIFQMYLEHQSLLPVVKELERLGWLAKQWTTHKGAARGGRPFDKHALYQLLTNVTYIGKVRYRDEVHTGEHQPIVDVDVFAQVQALLQRNGRSGGRAVRNKQGARLRGLLRCAACKCAMNHAYSAKGGRQYRYYVCYRAQQHGWQACPAPSSQPACKGYRGG